MDPLGHGQFAPKGQNLQDLCRGPLDIATSYISCGPSGFRRFIVFTHYKPMGVTDTQGLRLVSTRHCYMLSIYGFREEHFFKFLP